MSTPLPDRMIRVLDHIDASLDDDLDPAALAQLAGLSLHHFHRVFRGMVGESVMGHVRRLRMERAALRLKHGGGEILPLALALGYESHEAFTRAFRAHFGIPPSRFRRDATGTAASGGTATIREQPRTHLLCRPHRGAYDGVGAAWGELMAEVARLGLPARGPTYGLAYDDPEITPADQCRYDAGWPVVAPVAAGPGFVMRTLPAGRFAVAVHRGPYSGILESYVALLGGAVPRLGVELAEGPVVERYLDAPGSVPEAELRTEIMALLA